MKKRIIYSAVSLSALCCGISIAFFINQRSFMRGFAGDILIVIFIYSSLKVVLKDLKPFQMASGVFLFALFVEFIQFTGLPKYFHPGSMVTILTLGSTYDPLDIAAYAAGVLIIYFIDTFLIQNRAASAPPEGR
jgi:hypothetical protein